MGDELRLFVYSSSLLTQMGIAMAFDEKLGIQKRVQREEEKFDRIPTLISKLCPLVGRSGCACFSSL